MSATSENVATIEAALLEGASIRRVIDLQVATAGADLVVGAKVDLDEELTMKEVSTILAQAKRRVQTALPAARIVYIEPDVWVDPDAVPPTTSSIVMLGLD
ncbi:cation transporter dimerization domain-containing protein [Leucobacter soli]|uniref:Cation efflux protein cytoplasmic domain-containing protein n=2 Tax=Leucobacter soli TaxID=2812850 RepID=A0A916JYS8_9MICO|nr:cation transporter dimerization domain-containing protein [Leucobacter soli]CAG7613020.1 hypothetical protein LEUCIP111803_01641 [Leucobacter soli]